MVRDDSRDEAAGDEFDPTLPVGKPGNPASESYDVTRILSRIEQGEPQAAEQLLPLVYAELRKLAAAKMAQEKPDQTLQATALVHEAYIRLVDVEKVQHWNSRAHFYAAAAEAMRRILVEQARRKSRDKHGGGWQRHDCDSIELACHDDRMSDGMLLALDVALGKLASREPLKAKLVQLRFFGGLSTEEAAVLLEISVPTAKRYWRYVRAWLHAEVRSDDDSEQRISDFSPDS